MKGLLKFLSDLQERIFSFIGRFVTELRKERKDTSHQVDLNNVNNQSDGKKNNKPIPKPNNWQETRPRKYEEEAVHEEKKQKIRGDLIRRDCLNCGITKIKNSTDVPRNLRTYFNGRGIGVIYPKISCAECGSSKINIYIGTKLEIDSESLIICDCSDINCLAEEIHPMTITQSEHFVESGKELICSVCRDNCNLNPPRRLKNNICPTCRSQGRQGGFLTIRPGVDGNNDYIACFNWEGKYSKCSYYRELTEEDFI